MRVDSSVDTKVVHTFALRCKKYIQFCTADALRDGRTRSEPTEGPVDLFIHSFLLRFLVVISVVYVFHFSWGSMVHSRSLGHGCSLDDGLI